MKKRDAIFREIYLTLVCENVKNPIVFRCILRISQERKGFQKCCENVCKKATSESMRNQPNKILYKS